MCSHHNVLFAHEHKKSMHHLIGEHLDMTKCASSQNHALLKVVHDKVSKSQMAVVHWFMICQAVDAFLDLENYRDFWPLNDMIMMHLKYTSGRARQTQAKMAVGKSKSKCKKDSLKARWYWSTVDSIHTIPPCIVFLVELLGIVAPPYTQSSLPNGPGGLDPYQMWDNARIQHLWLI